jgi:hypothetical protein
MFYLFFLPKNFQREIEGRRWMFNGRFFGGSEGKNAIYFKVLLVFSKTFIWSEGGRGRKR